VGACGRRTRSSLPASGNPYRSRCRYHDQLALGARAMRPLRSAVAQHRARHPFGLPHEAERVWLFDLDNTLHDCSKGIFKAIDGAMANAVATTLALDADAANALRAHYWKRYGATVIGMVRHHGVDATTFLKLSHDFEVAPLV